MTDKTIGAELLNTDEVKALFESVGAPADKIDDFVEVFNAAVAAQTKAGVDSLVEAKVTELEAKALEHTNFLNEKAEEYKVLVKEEMEAKVDAYVKHFAEEFVADNKPVVESNVKAALFSSLMAELIGVFENHNIKLSDEQKDVLSIAEAELVTVKETLAESQAKVIELSKTISESKKTDILDAAVADLTESQAEKVRELASDLIFSEAYEAKVKRIVEAIASKPAAPAADKTDVVTESAPLVEEKPAVSSHMQSYLDAAKGQSRRLA